MTDQPPIDPGPEIQHLLERLGGELLLAEHWDLQALEGIRRGCLALAEIAVDAGIRRAVDDILSALDDIALDRCPDPSAELDRIRATVADLAAAKPVDAPALTEFLERHADIGDRFEALLLECENEENDEASAHWDEIARILHSLKGECGMLSLPLLHRWCHAVEDVVAGAHRRASLPLLLTAADGLRTAIAGDLDEAAVAGLQGMLPELHAAAATGGGDETEVVGGEPVSHQPELSGPSPDAMKAEAAERTEEDDDLLDEALTEIAERLSAIEAGLLALEEQQDGETINALFRDFHTIKGLAGFVGLADVQELSHAAESLLDALRSGRADDPIHATALVLEAADAIDGRVGELRAGGARSTASIDVELLGRLRSALPGLAPTPLLGEILTEELDVPASAIERAVEHQREEPTKRLGRILVEQGSVSESEIDRALNAQQAKRRKPSVQGQLRISADRVDALSDQIGELVVAQGMLAAADPEARLGTREIQTLLTNLDRITRDLQRMSTQMRTIPIQPLCQRMNRLVRDLALQTGKPVRFAVDGGEIEIDKKLVDGLNEPLVHLVRNAVDHGIEADPQDRVRAGKDHTATVHMRAFHQGGRVHIQIGDDGRGLDRERIVERGRERGLLAPGHEPSDEEVHALILQPGFSTARAVTDLSGRGVGLDVVRDMIEAQRGSLQVASTPGAGTTFTLSLPVTAAIIDGLVVTSRGSSYIAPTSAVLGLVRENPATSVDFLDQGRLMEFQGEHVPTVDLGAVFGDRVGAAEQRLVVLLGDGSRRAGIVVDGIEGRQQVVLKPLGAELPRLPGVGGATILGDGRVALVLDQNELLRHVFEQSPGRVAALPHLKESLS